MKSLALQSGSGTEEGTKDKVCLAILEGVEANETFMNSIVEEHRCMRDYYNACAEVSLVPACFCTAGNLPLICCILF